MQNDTKEVLKGSYKTAIAAFSSTLIINLVDSPIPVYSHDWFRHLVFASTTIFLLFEARYWYKWSLNGKATVKDAVEEENKNGTKN